MGAKSLNILAIALVAVLAGCSAFEDEPATEGAIFERPETAVDYQVELIGVENERAHELMEQALALFRRQNDGAQSLAFLRRRAEGDVETAQKILRSFGFYEAEDEGDTPAAQQAVARSIVTENRQYRLAEHKIALEEPIDGQLVLNTADYGEHVGKPVRASRILSAETRAVADLRSKWRPYAKRTDRDAVADPETAEIEVETTIAPGRAYAYGETTYEGTEGVDRKYLETYRHYETGQQVDPADLVAFQRADRNGPVQCRLRNIPG